MAIGRRNTPGRLVEVIPPEGKRWLKAVVVDHEGTVRVDDLACPVWGNCVLTRSQYRRIRDVEEPNAKLDE